MLAKVDVLAPQGNTVLFSLWNHSNGYVVKDITGLDPVKATLVSSKMAGRDGEEYQASSREKRNIIFTLDLRPEYVNTTVRDLRNRLAGIFMPKAELRLRFIDDDETFVDIYGIVETFDSPIFVKAPVTTISILCFDPDFYEPVPITVDGMTTSGSSEIMIDYKGSIATGIGLRMNVNRDLPAITIHLRPENGSYRDLMFDTALTPGSTPLVAGDVLDISTVNGDKGASRLRGGMWASVMYWIDPDSAWVTLSPGKNYIRVNSGGAPIAYTIDYINRYGSL